MVRVVQKYILNLAFVIGSLVHQSKNKVWLIGVDEVASMVSSISSSIPGSISISLKASNYYSFKYSYSSPRINNQTIWAIYRGIVGPFLLGYLAPKLLGVVYIGKSGFLFDQLDDRRFEFEWLKKHNKKIVCYFTGSDIRSPKLMLDFEKTTGLETLGGRITLLFPEFNQPSYDNKQKSIASVANKYADLIYNASIDQMSYLRNDTKPFRYFYPDEKFRRNTKKFTSFSSPLVVHAPSSPVLKGTSLVRKAVSELKAEGFEFEYLELLEAPHEEVLAALENAHIVLNEFYSFVPGVFGVEAMANYCALITSANDQVEKGLPAGSNQAWLQTYPDDIKTNLAFLLNNQKLSKDLASRGYQWAMKYASASSSGHDLRKDLDELFFMK